MQILGPTTPEIAGKEKFDELARKCFGSSFILGQEPSFCGLVQNIISQELLREEQSFRSKLRQGKQMIGNYNRKRTHIAISLRKNRLRMLNGFLTGYCTLVELLRKLNWMSLIYIPGFRESDPRLWCNGKRSSPFRSWFTQMI